MTPTGAGVMNLVRNGLRAAAGVALVAGATLATAAPASADPTQFRLECQSGGATISCSLFTDAIAPYTVRWRVRGVALPQEDDSHLIWFTCRVGELVPVQATITDRDGAISGTVRIRCLP